MVVAWVLFPLVFLAVCLGCGLLVERLTGWRMAGALLPAVGLALLIVASALTTAHAATASLTTGVVVVLAVAGFATSWRRLALLRPDPRAIAVGVAIFAICAAPVVLSGNATFLGYFVDTDPAFHFALASWMLAHGRDIRLLPLPSYSAYANVVHDYIVTAYPTGADVAVGAVRPLVGQDLAWVYQPYLAVVMALGAVAIQELLRGVVRSRALRATIAFVAAQGGLAYAFYLESSIKELVTALLITVTIVLGLETMRRPLRARALFPLGIVFVAALDVYSLAALPWLAPAIGVLAVIAGWRGLLVLRRTRPGERRCPSWRTAAWPATGVILVGLASPVLSGASTFATTASGVLSQQKELGNLAAPLSAWQLFGIWPSGDFRYPIITQSRIAFVLVGVAAAAAAMGALWMLRRRAWGPLLLLVGDGIAAAYLLSRASPYAASKVLMVLSVAVLVTAMLGSAALHESGRRIESWLLAAAVAGGVLWTNFLGYHDSSVAPQGRSKELAAIGTRFSRQGPAFYNFSDGFAVYLLRKEGAAVPETFAGPVPLLAGLPEHSFGQASVPWDPNELLPSFLQTFRLLILGRSPLLSRPPADYRLVYRGHYYDVWQRTEAPHVLRHIALSMGQAGPPSLPSCHAILTTAAVAVRDHARLAYVTRVTQPTLIPTQGSRPYYWPATPTTGNLPPDFVSFGQQPGSLTGFVQVPAAGRYQVWLEGTLSRRVIVWVGLHLVGTVTHQIGNVGQFSYVGTEQIRSGKQPVEIFRPPSSLTPGNTIGGEIVGPLVLAHSGGPPPVQELAPARAKSLCGKPLEWLEVVT